MTKTKPTKPTKLEAVFSASEFKSHIEGKFWTADDKAKWANQFIRFARSGFDRKYYNKAMYESLHQRMGFIAHYDIHGFWAARFDGLAAQIETVEMLTDGWSSCCGSEDYTWSDVGRAIRTWLLREGVLQSLQNSAANAQKARELALRDELVKKYGPPPAPVPKEELASLFELA